MKITADKLLLLMGLYLASAAGCKEGREIKTPSGMKVVVFRDGKGKKPVAGDWVSVNMVYRTEDDSVLFDSRPYGKPLRFSLPKPKFPGSFEEGLMQLSEGDSAAFYISADSMLLHMSRKDSTGQTYKSKKPGSVLRFDVSLVRVQPYHEAEMEIAENESSMEKAERRTLEAWLIEKNITASRDSMGFYLIPQKQGKGRQVENGMKIGVLFTGRFINGAAFDTNIDTRKPYEFTVGNNEVIRGWDLAFLRMREGDKATLILPSALGYGSEGLRMKNSLRYIVPPFSTLVFDVEVVNVSL